MEEYNSIELIPQVEGEQKLLSPPDPGHPGHTYSDNLIEQVTESRDGLVRDLERFKVELDNLKAEVFRKNDILVAAIKNNFDLAVEINNFTALVRERIAEVKNTGGK